MAKQLYKLACYPLVIISYMFIFAGCSVGRIVSYGADIGDSIFIYTNNVPTKIKEPHIGVLFVHYNHWDYRYDYTLNKDSITYADVFENFDACIIQRKKNEIMIIKKSHDSEMFRMKYLDSIKLHVVPQSYIDSRDKREYIIKSLYKK